MRVSNRNFFCILRLTLLRKFTPNHKRRWNDLKKDLKVSYLQSRSIEKGVSYRSFLTRCRRLNQLLDLGVDRVSGLKYLVFSKKLNTWRGGISQEVWQSLKTQIMESRVLSDIDEAVDRYCVDWLEILKDVYPGHIISFLGQGDNIESDGRQFSRSRKGSR